jgi:hypothetical protein
VILLLSISRFYSAKTIPLPSAETGAISSYFVFTVPEQSRSTVMAETDGERTKPNIDNLGPALTPSSPKKKLAPLIPKHAEKTHPTYTQNLDPSDIPRTVIEMPQENDAPAISISQINLALKDYESYIDGQQIQQMAHEEAAEFRQRQTSPKIIAPTKSLSPEQLEAQRRRIIVDCENAAKRGVSVISYLLGGTIECNQNPDFQQYINKRLNKGTPESSKP